jgi:NadR type nicotinamide-nucleotide adenylyltransferase
MQPLKKIVVIGPESTGKSTLCEQLAAHYGTVWTPEYAREYLLTHGMEYDYADLLVIAKGQVALEDAAATRLSQAPQSHSPFTTDSSPVLFIDTDLYVMKVWSEFVFGKCDPWILDQIGSRQYDGYLLCRTDIPWTSDALREYPDLATREKLFHIYKDCLVNQSTPWAEIGGQADGRLATAIDAVNRLIG